MQKILTIGLLLGGPLLVHAQTSQIDTSRGDRMIAEYFRVETEKIRDQCLSEVQTLDQWQASRERYRSELLEMLGLKPLPARTDLKAQITGRAEHEDFFVEQLHFQSRPGLYVTGNLYVPKVRDAPLPAILYVCGHAQVKKDGVSFGNKVHYQHHGGWFARNGYVCLTIDTLQLGEIEGIHHGTYREKMWWWLNRGYTPAGVEAWNCVRALDYLETREEVDASRIGVTGRSGGGAYSWWIAAIDDRVQCAVPVAGITDLQNHVVAGMPGRFHDGCVEGHCDCMYMLNTYRWDYPLIAALVAPRPLLISNTDSDGIFPLDGVYRTFEHARRIYRLHDAADKIALNITAGGHADTQELRVHAFRWFNQHLKKDEEPIRHPAEKFFEPDYLKVFKDLPADQQNSTIHESFVAAAQPRLPEDQTDWLQLSGRWKADLRRLSFAAWPTEHPPLDLEEVFAVEREGIVLRAIDFTSQAAIRLRLHVLSRSGVDRPERTVLHVLDDHTWNEFLAQVQPAFATDFPEESLPEADAAAYQQMRETIQRSNWAYAYFAPRGIGPSAWNQDEKKQTQHRRRFYLLGQTLDGMRVLDVRRAIQALRSDNDLKNIPLWLQSRGAMAGVTLYASIFEPNIARLDLDSLPTSHRHGPFLLNVRRFMDMPQAVAMASANSNVVLHQDQQEGWAYAQDVATKLGRAESLQFRLPLKNQE